MRRYGMGQNAIIKRNPKTTVATNSSLTHDNRLDEEIEDISRSVKVPLDNILDANTYDRIFSQGIKDEDVGKEENEGSQKRPMKFYRPGDPNHQSVRPTTAGFKYKYMAQDKLSRMQNEMVQVCLIFLLLAG